MTRFAVQALNLDGVAEASDLELRREGKSYTLDTLREIRGAVSQGRAVPAAGDGYVSHLPPVAAPRRRSPSCVPSAPFTAAPLDSAGDFASRSGGWNGSSAPT